MKIVVLGAGVMGCGVAWRLAQAGKSVTVLEKAVPGAEASSAAAGILGAQAESEGPGPLLDLCLRSRQAWPQFWAQLRATTGIDVGLIQEGLLELAHDDAGCQRLLHRQAWMQAANLRADLLDPNQARALEPALGPTLRCALHLPDDHQVEPPLLARALAAAAVRAGARLVPRSQVQGLDRQGDRVVGVRTATETLACDAVVVATGAWTDLLPDLAPRRAAIEPVHGQLVLLDTRPPLLRKTLALRHGYVVPRADGRVVCGATMEQTGYDKQVTAAGLRHVLGLALDAVPALADSPVLQHWSGLRPRSADDLPLLGPHRTVQGLHFATGHHRNGILLAPVTAEAVAAGVLGQNPGFELAAFAP